MLHSCGKKRVLAITRVLCFALLLVVLSPSMVKASEIDAYMLQKSYEEQMRLEELKAQKAVRKAEIAQSYTMVQKSASTSRVKSMGYWCYRPTVSTDEALPLIVYLHGSDGRGSNLNRLLQIESIPSFINNGDIYPDAIVISPQCPSGQSWSSLANDVMELIAQVIDEENVDINRISLTGCSLGGCGTFSIALKNPDFFSAVVPVCASVNAANCKVLNNVPMKIFHGTKDYGMGFSVKSAAQVINQNGGNCELIMLEGEGHEIRHVYKDEEFDLLDWMSSQNKSIIE